MHIITISTACNFSLFFFSGSVRRTPLQVKDLPWLDNTTISCLETRPGVLWLPHWIRVGLLFPWCSLSSGRIVLADLRLRCVGCVRVVSGVEKVTTVAPEGLSLAGLDAVASRSLCRLDDCCWSPTAVFMLETDGCSGVQW